MPVRDVSLFKPNAGAPLDIQGRQAQLAQQAAIAQALIAQSMEQTSPIIPTGRGNPFGTDIPNLAPIGQAIAHYRAQKKLEELGKEKEALDAETQRVTERDLAEAMARREGREMAPSIEEMGPGEQMEPDYPGYVKALTGSQIPRLQKMGEEAAKHMITPQTVAQYGDKFARNTLEGYGAGRGAPQPKPILKEAEGVIRPFSEEGAATGPPTPITTYKPPAVNPVTGLPGQENVDTGRVQSQTGGNVTPDKAAALKGVDAMLDDIKKAKPDYQKNVNSMTKLAQAEYDIAKAPESAFGELSWVRARLGKFSELLGADAAKSTSDIESIRSTLGSIALDKARILAPVSDNDWDKIREILGTEGYTKRALQEVVQIMLRATARETGAYTSGVAAAAQNPLIGGGDPEGFIKYWAPSFTTTPYQGAGSEGAPSPYSGMSDDEIKKRLRGGR